MGTFSKEVDIDLLLCYITPKRVFRMVIFFAGHLENFWGKWRKQLLEG